MPKIFSSLSFEESDALIAERWEKDQEEKMRIQAVKILNESNIPKRHLDQKEWTGDKWLKVESRLNARSGSGFIIALCGHRGTGKTQLAASLARSVALSGKTVRYQTAMGFFLDIKESFDGKKSEKEVIANYAAPRLLIFDEMQERGETAWEDRLITHLIDKRYGMEKDTLLITNQNTEEFQKSIGNSVASRISETGGFYLCDWPSYRQPKQK